MTMMTKPLIEAVKLLALIAAIAFVIWTMPDADDISSTSQNVERIVITH